MVNKPARKSGYLIDQIYIKKALMEKIFTNVTVGNIYFSVHDVVRIVTENSLIF